MQPLTIEIIRKWDARAAKMLYEHFYAALVSYAMQFTKDAETSEDMVQDIITALWERKIEFSSLPMMKAYLYNSVRNRCLNYLQRPSSLGSPLTKFTNSDEAFSMIDEDSEQIFTEEVYRQLFLMIDQMPQRQREVFLMVMEGRNNKEIADALHIAVETVRTNKKRAMSFLRKHLDRNSILLLLFLLSK